MSMTMADRAKLANELCQIRQKIAGYSSTPKYQMNEASTIRLLIEPALDALGWNTDDPSQVYREHKTSGGGKVDLALLIDDKPVLYVEAKALKESTEESKWITQTLNYAIADGVEWCVLTNGASYRIFKSHALADLDGKSFGTVIVSNPTDETPIESVATSLSLLSPQSMKSKDLNALWSMHEIDGKLEAYLKGIAERPEFHKWLSRSVCKDLNARQIGQSLQRSNFSISYPDIHKYINELEKNKEEGHAADSTKPYQPPVAEPTDRHLAKSYNTLNTARGDLPKQSTGVKDTTDNGKAKKMRTAEMVEKGLLPIGTVLTIKNRSGSEAKVVDGKSVNFHGNVISFHEWGKRVLQSKVSIYLYATLPNNKTLDQIRKIADKNRDISTKKMNDSVHKKSRKPTNLSGETPKPRGKGGMRTPEMFEKGLLTAGTVLTIKNRPGSEATVVDGQHVNYKGSIIKYNEWAQKILGYPVSIYDYVLSPNGRKLREI